MACLLLVILLCQCVARLVKARSGADFISLGGNSLLVFGYSSLHTLCLDFVTIDCSWRFILYRTFSDTLFHFLHCCINPNPRSIFRHLPRIYRVDAISSQTTHPTNHGIPPPTCPNSGPIISSFDERSQQDFDKIEPIGKKSYFIPTSVPDT